MVMWSPRCSSSFSCPRRQSFELLGQLTRGGDVLQERLLLLVADPELAQPALDVRQDSERFSSGGPLRGARLRHQLVHLRAQARVQMVEVVLDVVRRRASTTRFQIAKGELDLAPPLVGADERRLQSHRAGGPWLAAACRSPNGAAGRGAS